MEFAIKRHRTVCLLLTFPLVVALGLAGCQSGGSADPPPSEPTAASTASATIARPDPTNSPAPVPHDTPTSVSRPSTARPDPTNSPVRCQHTDVRVPSFDVTVSSTSTPVPNGVYFPCDLHLVGLDAELVRTFTFISWTPDGSRLIFNEGLWEPGIMIASANGSSIRTIVDATTHRHEMPYGYHADISPDGSQLVYTTCQFPTRLLDPMFTGNEWYSYEIATISLDGGGPIRLSGNTGLDHVPSWSPDGTRIAFVAEPPRQRYFLHRSTRLYTMAADGTDVLDVVPSLGGVTLSPPQWSPDGQRLSFLVKEDAEKYPRHYPRPILLYTVGLDGSKLQRISETITSPSWSPSGNHLAFGRNDGEVDAIYTVKPDGTDEQKLVDAPGVQQVSWSPNGNEILFVTESVHVVRPDGAGLTEVYTGVGRAAWSPDGSRIAIYDDRSGRVVSLARDGTDLRVVAEVGQDGWQHAVQPTQPEVPTEPPTGSPTLGIDLSRVLQTVGELSNLAPPYALEWTVSRTDWNPVPNPRHALSLETALPDASTSDPVEQRGITIGVKVKDSNGEVVGVSFVITVRP